MRKNERDIQFNVDAYTAKLIGRENVSKLEGAVLEIVKNAYDADAKLFCFYWSEKNNCIYILDNGTGMKEEIRSRAKRPILSQPFEFEYFETYTLFF